MTPEQVLTALEQGLRETWRLMIDLAEDPDTDIRPEYLKSIAVAQALKAAAPTSIVRLEQPTGAVLAASIPTRPAKLKGVITRSGRVDILLSVSERGFKRPLVVVENKRYAKAFSSIEADVERCLQFIRAQGASGTLEVAAVTYLWRETAGRTKQELDRSAKAALDRITLQTMKDAAAVGVAHDHYRVRLDGNSFETVADADAINEHGAPAHVHDEPWAVWGCVELFPREPATPLLADLPSAVSARRPCERLVAPQ